MGGNSVNNTSSRPVEAFYDQIFYSNLPTVTILVIFSVLGLIANSLVLLVNSGVFRNTAVHLIMYVMAMADFFTSLVVIPCHIAIRVSLHFQYAHLCQFLRFLWLTGIMSNIYLQVAISYVRYRMVIRLQSPLVSVAKAGWFCAAGVGVATAFGVLYSAVSSTQEWRHATLGESGTTCSFNKDFESSWVPVFYTSGFFSYFCCFISLIVFNFRIGYQAFKHKKEIKAEFRKSMKRKSQLRARRRSDDTENSLKPESELHRESDQTEDTVRVVLVSSTTADNQDEVLSEDISDQDAKLTKPGHAFMVFFDKFGWWHAISDMGKATIVLCMISFFYILSYVPFFTERIYVLLSGKDPYLCSLEYDDCLTVFKTLSNTFFLSCVFHPILYHATDIRFRRRCRSFFKCLK